MSSVEIYERTTRTDLHHILVTTSVRVKTQLVHTYSHQLGWISPNGIELEPRLPDKLVEDAMCSQADSMTLLLKLVAQCDERLYISPTTNNLNDNVERGFPLYVERLWVCIGDYRQIFLCRYRQELSICLRKS